MTQVQKQHWKVFLISLGSSIMTIVIGSTFAFSWDTNARLVVLMEKTQKGEIERKAMQDQLKDLSTNYFEMKGALMVLTTKEGDDYNSLENFNKELSQQHYPYNPNNSK